MSAERAALGTTQEVAQNTSAPDATDVTRLHHDALSERALDVLDGMSVCELAWHEGGSMPETLYACLYLHPITFSAMLRELGWEPPPLGSEGMGKRALDLGIKEREIRDRSLFFFRVTWRNLDYDRHSQFLGGIRCLPLEVSCRVQEKSFTLASLDGLAWISNVAQSVHA